MKVIGVKMRGTSYIVDAQIDSASVSSFQLRTDRKVLAVHGAIWKALSPDTYALTIAPTSSPDRPHSYSAIEVVVDLTRFDGILERRDDQHRDRNGFAVPMP
jgi:hypothetical protein